MKRVLPRSHPVLHLYEVADVADDELAEFRSSDVVESLFESNVPPVFRAIVQVGSVVRYRHGYGGDALRQPGF